MSETPQLCAVCPLIKQHDLFLCAASEEGTAYGNDDPFTIHIPGPSCPFVRLDAANAEIESLKEDEERLDFLQSLNCAGFDTGRCVLRLSGTGRGWRLHESNCTEASHSVRVAIDAFRAAFKGGRRE
jgi:hypothetical protein